MRYKISEWISNSISKINITGSAMDVHVDNFIDFSNLNEMDMVKSSLDLFKLFIKCFNEVKQDSLSMYLNIELKEFGNTMKGAPNSFEELCSEFDQFSIPEIILYKPVPLIRMPMTELYRRPLLFEQLTQYSQMSFFYKEDRIIESMNEETEFRREVNVIYVPNF